MNRIYFANKGHTRKHGCPNLWPVVGGLFGRTPKELFNEPGLVAYVDPKLVNHQYFEAHISIYNTTEVTYHPNWDNTYEYMTGGCILNGTVGRNRYVSMHTHIKETNANAFNDSEIIWGSRQAAIALLKEATLQFIQYFPQPGNPV